MKNFRRTIFSTTFAATSALHMMPRVPPGIVLRGGSRGVSMEAVMDKPNPLLEQTGLPRFDAIDASHVKTGVSLLPHL